MKEELRMSERVETLITKFEVWWEKQVGNSTNWTTLERAVARDAFYEAYQLAKSECRDEYTALKKQFNAACKAANHSELSARPLSCTISDMVKEIALLKEQLAAERKKMMDMRDEESILQGKLEIAEYEITRLMEG